MESFCKSLIVGLHLTTESEEEIKKNRTVMPSSRIYLYNINSVISMYAASASFREFHPSRSTQFRSFLVYALRSSQPSLRLRIPVSGVRDPATSSNPFLFLPNTASSFCHLITKHF